MVTWDRTAELSRPSTELQFWCQIVGRGRAQVINSRCFCYSWVTRPTYSMSLALFLRQNSDSDPPQAGAGRIPQWVMETASLLRSHVQKALWFSAVPGTWNQHTEASQFTGEKQETYLPFPVTSLTHADPPFCEDGSSPNHISARFIDFQIFSVIRDYFWF